MKYIIIDTYYQKDKLILEGESKAEILKKFIDYYDKENPSVIEDLLSYLKDEDDFDVYNVDEFETI